MCVFFLYMRESFQLLIDISPNLPVVPNLIPITDMRNTFLFFASDKTEYYLICYYEGIV